jgi:hypothetical protein
MDILSGKVQETLDQIPATATGLGNQIGFLDIPRRPPLHPFRDQHDTTKDVIDVMRYATSEPPQAFKPLEVLHLSLEKSLLFLVPDFFGNVLNN